MNEFCAYQEIRSKIAQNVSVKVEIHRSIININSTIKLRKLQQYSLFITNFSGFYSN